MSLPRSRSEKIPHHSRPGAPGFWAGGLRLLLVSALFMSVSTPLVAGSRMQNPDATAVIDLPVVKPDKTRSLHQTMKQLDDARVVLVGETHTRYDHHLVQLEILKQLYQKSPNIALGVEWFQQPFQEHLDAYIAGDITEKEMLRLTEYFTRWRYNYRHYRPILQFARENRIPVIALNASRELTKALAHTDPDDLPEELKSQLPGSYDWSDKDYEKRVRDVFELHPEYQGEFENFMRSQLTWDESMAERASQYLQENPDSTMLVLAGSGHIMFGSGIPNRIQRRIETEPVTVLVSDDHLPVAKDIADFLVMSVEQTLEPDGLIGAILDTDGKLLTIKGFSHNSAVKDAGLEKGAIIIGVDDEPVESFSDFKVAIIDKQRGDSIELHYLENADAGNKDRKSVTIELR
jgi:uncharacterized iron-regulated protein